MECAYELVVLNNSGYHLLNSISLRMAFSVGSNKKFYSSGLSYRHLSISRHKKSRDTQFHG